MVTVADLQSAIHRDVAHIPGRFLDILSAVRRYAMLSDQQRVIWAVIKWIAKNVERVAKTYGHLSLEVAELYHTIQILLVARDTHTKLTAEHYRAINEPALYTIARAAIEESVSTTGLPSIQGTPTAPTAIAGTLLHFIATVVAMLPTTSALYLVPIIVLCANRSSVFESDSSDYALSSDIMGLAMCKYMPEFADPGRNILPDVLTPPIIRAIISSPFDSGSCVIAVSRILRMIAGYGVAHVETTLSAAEWIDVLGRIARYTLDVSHTPEVASETFRLADCISNTVVFSSTHRDIVVKGIYNATASAAPALGPKLVVHVFAVLKYTFMAPLAVRQLSTLLLGFTGDMLAQRVPPLVDSGVVYKMFVDDMDFFAGTKALANSIVLLLTNWLDINPSLVSVQLPYVSEMIFFTANQAFIHRLEYNHACQTLADKCRYIIDQGDIKYCDDPEYSFLF